MAEWVLMPTTQAESKAGVSTEPCDYNEYKYRIYIPLPMELVKQIEVGQDMEIVLKGDIKKISMSEDEKESSGEVCLRVKAVKLPEKKKPMEDYAQSLMDEDYED